MPLSAVQIAYRKQRAVQQQVSMVDGGAQQLPRAVYKPRPAALASKTSVLCHSASAPAALAADCEEGLPQLGAADLQQHIQMREQRLAPLLTTHSSSGLLACSTLEPQTPAETPPQLSRAFTAEGPSSYLASPQQHSIGALTDAQACAAHSVASQITQLNSRQISEKILREDGSASAKQKGPASTQKAPKLALRVVPKDTETAEHIEAQGGLAYFELSCR